MAIRSLLKKISTPIDEIDRAKLSEFAVGVAGAAPLDELPLRTPVLAAGEVRTGRIVPRAGSPACEVTISDGKGLLVAVFLGRRALPGLATGRRIIVSGVAARRGRELMMINPMYEFA